MSVVRGVARLSWVLSRRVNCVSVAKFQDPFSRAFSLQFYRKVSTNTHQVLAHSTQQAEERENSRPANRSSSADQKESRRNTVKLKRMPQDQKNAFFAELQKTGRADVYHYSTMLSSCSNSAQAQALMREMERVGVQPNLVTYNTLIQKHNRDGQAELAQQVLEEMISNGVTPDVVTYSSIIDGLSRNQKHREAARMWRELQDAGIALDLFAYNIAVNMHCRANRELNARKTIAQMTAAGIAPTSQTFTPLIAMYSRQSKPAQAVAVLKEVQALGLDIDTRTYNAAVSALGNNGWVEEAEALVGVMRGAQQRAHTNNAHPAPAASSSSSSSPSSSSASSPSSSPSSSSSASSSSAYSSSSSPSPSSPPRPSASASSSPPPVLGRKGAPADFDCGTIAALIEGYGRRGEMELVWQTRARLEAAGLRPDVRVYTALIHVLCINSMLEEAVSEFVEMEESGEQATAVTMQALIDGFALSGDRLGAMQWLWEARRRNLPPFSSYMQRDDVAGVIKADLHGMSALTSVVAVEFALSFAPRALYHKVVVVTGQGRHSQDRRAVVKPVIEGFLSEEGIRFAAADGNEGRLELIRHSATLPSLVFCCLLLAIMWLMGAMIARDWLERARQMNQHLAHTRKVEKLREELRRGLADHASGRRSMVDLALQVEEIEREWRAAEKAQEALRKQPKHTRGNRHAPGGASH